jgi:transcriptional regulator with XRE-family HTH domain
VSTPGGARLRELRERAGRAQLWVEAEADLGTGYLQRLESGRVVQPERATVEKVLEALGARFDERREVLGLFGYAVAAARPDAADLAWARDLSRHQLAEANFPTYVLDCAHRLVSWNCYLPRLLGRRPADPLADLAERSLLMAWFDDAGLFPMVAEPDLFLPALVRALRYEMRQFRAEPWYPELLDGLNRLPRFRQAWASVEAEEQPPASAARALVPVRLVVPGAGRLQFRLSSEPFTRDSRFRIVYLFPADPATMAWSGQLEEARR